MTRVVYDKKASLAILLGKEVCQILFRLELGRQVCCFGRRFVCLQVLNRHTESVRAFQNIA